MVRRFLTRVLMVILIGCCGYNWLQIRQLQSQVSGLNTRLSLKNAHQKPPSLLDWNTLQGEVKQLRMEADALWRKANETQKTRAVQKTQGAHKGKIP